MEKAIVCYSGGHSSALVAVEATRKYGKDNIILLNHDISPLVEHEDIKRFKGEVADYLGIPITYANHPEWDTKTPLDIAVDCKGFQCSPGRAFCTSRLKTEPFHRWLKDNVPPSEDVHILYGFDAEEQQRIMRRSTIIGAMGYKAGFPLAEWERTILEIEEIGIEKPSTYRIFKHANCIGCLKAGKQHWYCVYCLRSDIWEQAKATEELLGYSIIRGVYLAELEPQFHEMKNKKGICPSEKMPHQTFWAMVGKEIPEQQGLFPCDCSF